MRSYASAAACAAALAPKRGARPPPAARAADERPQGQIEAGEQVAASAAVGTLPSARDAHSDR